MPACSPQSLLQPQSIDRNNDDGGDDDCLFPRAVLGKHIPLSSQHPNPNPNPNPNLNPTNTFTTVVGERLETIVADFEHRITFEDFFPREIVNSSLEEGDSGVLRDTAPEKENEQQIDGIILEKNQRYVDTTDSSSSSSSVYTCSMYQKPSHLPSSVYALYHVCM